MKNESQERLVFLNEKLRSLELDIDELYQSRDECIDSGIGFSHIQKEINTLLDQRDSLEIERYSLSKGSI